MAYNLTDAINSQVYPLAQQAVGDPQSYSGTFQSAYGNINQGPNAPQNIVSGGVNQLADSFIERFYENNGKMPDVGQIKDFVSSNVNNSYAQNYIKGSLNGDQIKSQLVDPYLQSKGLSSSGDDPTGVQGRMDALNSQLDQYYNGASQFAQDSINREYNNQKIGEVNDMAGSGQSLSSPATRYSLNDLEGQRGVANANAQAQLASSKAAGQVDLSKTIENVLAGQRALQQNAGQFGQSLQFSKDQAQNQIDLQNKSLNMASVLGKLQAGAQGAGWGAGAAGGAIGGAALGAHFGPWGALAGGAGGALVGALGSRK